MGYEAEAEMWEAIIDNDRRDHCAMCPKNAVIHEGVNEGLCGKCAAEADTAAERSAAGIDSCCAEATFGLAHGTRCPRP